MILERITRHWSGCVPIGSRYLTLADLDEALFAIELLHRYAG